MKKTLLLVVAFLAITFGSNAQWIIQNTGFTTQYRGINYISIVNSNVVWATAYDGSGGGNTINEFTRTTNGGTTWTPGQVLGGTTYGLGNISAIDDLTAWVALYSKNAQDNTCGVYKTTNGGTTWTHQNCLQGSASFADNVWFWDANVGFAHGDVRDNYFEVYTTSNGGTTWTRVPIGNFTPSTVISGEGGWTGVMEVTGWGTALFGTNKGKIQIYLTAAAPTGGVKVAWFVFG